MFDWVQDHWSEFGTLSALLIFGSTIWKSTHGRLFVAWLAATFSAVALIVAVVVWDRHDSPAIAAVGVAAGAVAMGLFWWSKSDRARVDSDLTPGTIST